MMAVDINFSNREKEAIEILRDRMKGHMEPEMYEDLYLFRRFLKAQEFNINNAELMLNKHLEWRKKKNIKNIINYKKPEVVEKYLSYTFLGYDKEGCVVRYSHSGNVDIIGLSYCFKLEELEDILLHETETDGIYLNKKSKELGRNVDKCVYIFNMENFSFKMATDKKVIYVFINFLCAYENNYPERMKIMYIINCSMYFMIFFNILKNFLSSTILNKMHIYSDETYKDDILKVVDADVIPAFLGGTRTDPDGNPLCLTFINRAGPVPETYYKHKSKRSLASMAGVKKVTLSNAAFHEEYLEVKERGSYLEWEFETKSRDIGFGVFYVDATDGDSKMSELIPHQRIDTEDYAETGTYLCDKIGTYVVLFDNSYSWIRSKEIFYRIKVISPGEKDSQLKYEMTSH